MFKKLFIYSIFSVAISVAQQEYQIHGNGEVHESNKNSPGHICRYQDFTVEKIAAKMEKIRAENPELYRKMQIPVSVKKTKNAKVGDLGQFWISLDINDTAFDSLVTCELLAKGKYTAIWSDTAEISRNNSISRALGVEYLQAMEESTPSDSRDSTKGIYDLLIQYFGSPPNKDGDGIVDYVFADLQPGTGGYFSPSDQSNGSGSNQRDMLYVDAYQPISYNKGTIAHEFQHLIHYTYTRKDLKFNEGLSQMASIMCGYSVPFSRYLSSPSSYGWSYDDFDSPHYDMGALFTLYYVEQLGDASIKDFLSINASGWQAFGILLNKYNTGLNYKEWLKNWYIANYLNDKSVNSAYGYDLNGVGKAQATFWHTSGLIASENLTLEDYGVNYIYFSSNTDSLPMTFTSLVGGEPIYNSLETNNDLTVSINSISNAQEYLVENDISKVTKVTFFAINQSVEKASYKYETKGKNVGGWTNREIAYDDGDVDNFDDRFGYYGYGPSGLADGDGWGVEFDPKTGENQLINFSFNFGFAQDFGSGSDIPDSAPKSFNIRVWSAPNTADGIVKSLLPPIKYDGKAAGQAGVGWVTVDLSAYKTQLSNLGKVIVGITDDDTLGAYFGLDQNAQGENYTYQLYESGTPDYFNTIPFETNSNNNISFNGWNFLYRTTWLLKNTITPVIHAGLMQHSIFTDAIKIYTIGNSTFDPTTTVVKISNNSGAFETLPYQSFASNEKLLISDYKLKSSGELDINVTGNYYYSKILFDKTFKYSVNHTFASDGAQLFSRDGDYSVTIPKNSLEKDAYVVISKNNFFPNNEKNNFSLTPHFSPVYTVGPIGLGLEKSIEISFILEIDNTDELSVGYWDGEFWRELNSFISADKRYIKALGAHLGQYALIKKGSGMPLAIEKDELIPFVYSLNQNYPNPFNPDTRISYDIPESGLVNLTVFDILGRELVNLVSGRQAAGRYNILWNGNDAMGDPVSSGIYLYQLKTVSFSQTKKMILSR